MSAHIVIETAPYQGRYELDPNRAFNAREWRCIRMAGWSPRTLDDGYRDGDPDLFVALAVIAMGRAGKVARGDEQRVADELAEVPWDGTIIRIEFDREDDPGPLELTNTPGESSPSRTHKNGSSSGERLKTGSVL